MSLLVFQEMLASLYLRPSVRARWAKSGSSDSAPGELSSRERSALRGIDRNLLSWFAEQATYKGSSPILGAFPRTTRHLGPRVEAIYKAVLDAADAPRERRQLLLAFGTRTLDVLRTEARPSLAACDVARFELTCALLSVTPHEPAGLIDVQRLQGRSIRWGGRVVRFDAAYVQSFACDVLSTLQPNRASALRPTSVLFYRSRGKSVLLLLGLP